MWKMHNLRSSSSESELSESELSSDVCAERPTALLLLVPAVAADAAVNIPPLCIGLIVIVSAESSQSSCSAAIYADEKNK